jgi:8-oxo-dGTP diphosphatase
MNMDSAEAIKNLSVDCVIFGFEKWQLEALLIKLNVEPGMGQWALPGGNVNCSETLDDAAQRVLEELTGVTNVYMTELSAFSALDRFPLFRVVTIAYYALIKPENYSLNPGPKASEVGWFKISDIPMLPFDHDLILKSALKRLAKDIQYMPVGFELLPKKFTLTQLQSLYESIYNRKLDKRNFRKKILSMNLLVELSEKQQGVAHRAARLYRFDKKNYEQLKEKGFNFEI